MQTGQKHIRHDVRSIFPRAGELTEGAACSCCSPGVGGGGGGLALVPRPLFTFPFLISDVLSHGGEL